MVRIALLGAGRIGAIHARTVAASRDAELAAIADPIEQAAQALTSELGGSVRTVDAAIDDRSIDAVLIATPTDTHAALIERAAAAGKAIFCEKPIDLDADRVRACLAAVERAGVPLFVGFNRRFDPSFANLRRRLRDGEIGDLELLTITSRDPAPPPLTYIERSGGLFRDMMIHDLDMACWLLDEPPAEVHAVAACLTDPEIGRAGDVDTAAVMLRTASGRICQISNSRRATYGYDQRIEAHGSAGMLLADNQRPTTVSTATAQGVTSDPAMPFFLERYADAYRLELDAFIRSVSDGTPPEPGGADGLRALLLADAATAAARTGTRIVL